MDWCRATALAPPDFSSIAASKPPCPEMGLASVGVAAMDWAATIMTLGPLNFSFPSTATAIVKMEVDQRRIGIEGLEFGVVKTEMVLKLEVVTTGDVKKLQRGWWGLIAIKGKSVVINGNSGRRSPRAAITWWLCFNSFFSVEKPRRWWREEIEKMSQETSSNFDRYWHGGLDATMEEKSEGAKATAAPHQSIATTTTTVTYFWSVMKTRKGNLGTKNGADSKYIKTILLFILKSSSHIS